VFRGSREEKGKKKISRVVRKKGTNAARGVRSGVVKKRRVGQAALQKGRGRGGSSVNLS